MTKEQIAELYKSRKTTDYDGIVKQLMSKMQDEKIIQFLGCMFSKNYTEESKITRLCSETHDVDNHKKISDFYIKVDDDFFNIEVQSRSDKTMALKMMESGVALDIIQKCSGLSDSGMEKLVSQYKKSLETAENTNERGGMKR